MADDDQTQDTETPEETSNGASSGSSSINQQILDAVLASNQYAFGVAPDLVPDSNNTFDGTQLNAGTPIAYQKVAQALAISVQDAVDFQRNMLSMTAAASGKALQLAFEDVAEVAAGDPTAEKQLEDHALILLASLLTGAASALIADGIVEQAGVRLSEWPKN